MATKKETDKTKLELTAARQNFKLYLLENPNYFGSISKDDVLNVPKPVFSLKHNTTYEELTCIGFAPGSKEINAIVVVKQKTGYSGGPCTDGSKEYVRFYLDYDGSGTWVDEGVVNFTAHDLSFGETLSYDVKMPINPEKLACCQRAAILPRVRAILSWNEAPPEAQPNWAPPWGNVVEATIQLPPSTSLICHLGDIRIDLKDIKPELLSTLSKELTPVSKPDLSILELKEIYGKNVEATRIAAKAISQLTTTKSASLQNKYAAVLKEAKINIAEVTEFQITSKFNTSYEELKCVGLNRDLNLLTGNVHVKKTAGYSGNMCTPGSLEYVAFYMDFGAGYAYMGTSSVVVHDIPTLPADGLWYAVELPVSLADYQKTFCETGKAKVRAILSWNTPPVPNNPEWVAAWGDWEECYVEIKPLPEGVGVGDGPLPYIETLGGMPVSMIDKITGLANGESSSGVTGNDSPFDGRIDITGLIFFAPDSYGAGAVAPLRYRVMVKGDDEADYTPLLRKFKLDVTTVSGGTVIGPISTTMTPNHDGFVDYLPDTTGAEQRSVAWSKLGEFYAPVSGKYELFIHVVDPATGMEYESNHVWFMVDKDAPQVAIDITSGGGNCGVFGDSEIMTGTFSITGNYCDTVTLSVSPGGSGWPSHGATPIIVGKLDNQLVYGADLPDSGYAGTWTLDTTPMDPCGYNIRVHGEDRTIINSRYRGHEVWAVRGFCIMPDAETGV